MQAAHAWKTRLSIVLAALLLMFAPLYHAACVAVSSIDSSASAPTTMVMPDGTVMTHGAQGITSGLATLTTAGQFSTADLSTAGLTTARSGPGITSPNELDSNAIWGAILLIAGLVMLSTIIVWGSVRRLHRETLPPHSSADSTRAVTGRSARHRPPPDLTVLCISRT